MQTKVYFASSVPAALELARKELGDEAMLVESKPASPEGRPFGRLEVTFAYDPKAIPAFPIPQPAPQPMPQPLQWSPQPASFPRLDRTPERTPAPVLPRSAAVAFQRLAEAARPAAPPQENHLATEVDEIRRQLAELKRAVTPAERPVFRPTTITAHESRTPLAEHLIERGLTPGLANEIAASPRLRAGQADAATLTRELVERMPVAAFPEIKPGESRTIALVGPPGRGKTTTLMKIAIRFGLSARVPVKIYMAGAHGVGCEEQLSRYATVLGVPFQACEQLENLTLALNGDSWKGLGLIDTPGISPSDSAEIGEFARFFRRRKDIEKHLVLRADARPADISHVIARFSAMDISRLLFTGLDEAVSLGSVADAIMRSRIPASLAGTGQRIPEDIQLLSAGMVAHTLQRELTDTALNPMQIESASAAVAA